jgi:RNA polymerase sigma factor (sigma-70 family)
MEIQPELIGNCLRGDRRAEYELYKRTFPYLMSICIRYTRQEDKAKEVLNQGFLRILTHLEKYNKDIPFKAWIRRVMINTLINEFKKEKIHNSRIDYVEEYKPEQFHEVNDALKKADTEEIYRAIASLPDASRQVFNLYYVEGFKHREIAEMLEISEGTSKWHLNFAREKLKELLKKNEELIKSAGHGS